MTADRAMTVVPARKGRVRKCPAAKRRARCQSVRWRHAHALTTVPVRMRWRGLTSDRGRNVMTAR